MPIRPPLHNQSSKTDRDKRHDARRGTPAERGYDNRWRKARAYFLAAHPLCVMCEREGFITAASVVDHITPHKGNPDLFWDRENWQPLCSAHHNSDKQAIERGGRPRQTIGSDGWPVS